MKNYLFMRFIVERGIPEFLDSGRWTLDAGLWTLDAGRWTLDATLRKLGSGP